MITSVFIPGNQDTSEPFAIRREVFVKEQGCPEAEEFDSFDASALHLMIYVDEMPAATGRIWHDGKGFRMGRLAALPQYRGQKIGDLALRLLLYKAFSSGAEELSVSAQVYLRHFYEKFGFVAEGEEYMEAGRPHIAMRVKKDDVKYPSACHPEG
jgi:predicted GNAT family N-acyltransferase